MLMKVISEDGLMEVEGETSFYNERAKKHECKRAKKAV